MGASLKKALVCASSSSLDSASTWLGKVPLAWNALICCSGAVSQVARAWASSGCSLCAGTVRKEPPQLPPPPGKTSAMSQPVTPSALPSITPSIQPGQSMVAKPSFWNAANQSSLHWLKWADRLSSTEAARTSS